MTESSVYGGLFSDPPVISTDADPKKTDPYNKMDTIPSRYLGKGLSIDRGGPGRNPDVFFEKKYLTLASPDQNGNKNLDPFVDTRTRLLREAMESKKKNISDRVFLPPSYPKTSDGPGSYSGCFQSRAYEFFVPKEGDSKARRRRKKAAAASFLTPVDKTKTGLPNVKTNPSKRGTYGFPGTLFDNPKYDENWRDKYEQWKAAEKKEKRNIIPKEIGPPFKIPGVTHSYLDELSATGVSGVYRHVPVEEKPSKKKKRAKQAVQAATFEQEKPMFFVSAKSGYEGCLSDFPNTWINPDELDAARNKGQKKKKHRKPHPEYVPGPPKGASGLWKPSSFPTSSVVQSCLHRFY